MHINRINEGTVFRQAKIRKTSLLSMFSCYNSTDYKNATEVMRGVLVQSINLEMIDDVKKIKTPTLLIWGSLDTAVPINRAYELESLIKDAKVVEYEGATHYAYLERKNEVIKVIDDFIGK